MNNLTYISYLENFSLWLESNYMSIKAQLLYMRLLMVFNKAHFPESIQLSNYKLMDMLCCGINGMSKARDELVKLEFITYESSKRGKPCKYYLVKKDGMCYNGSGITIPKKEQVNKKKEKDVKKKEKKEEEIRKEDWGFGPDLTEAFSRWLQYKKERKEDYKPTGLSMLITKIRNKKNDYTEDQIVELINHCMAQNWKGIIWDLLPEKEKEYGYEYDEGNHKYLGEDIIIA